MFYRSFLAPRKDIFRFDNYTQFHEELRMIRPDGVLNKWATKRSLVINNTATITNLYNLILTGDTNRVLDTASKIFNLRTIS